MKKKLIKIKLLTYLLKGGEKRAGEDMGLILLNPRLGRRDGY